MNIQVTISLGATEHAADLSGNATEIADKILVAVGADPEKDVCQVSISDYGQAGGSLAPTPPPETPPTETINSTFATNNSPPPGDKQIRTNTALAADATAVYVDNQSTEGDDVSAKLLQLMVGDTINLSGVSDTSRYAVFTLNAAPINQTDYVELPVDHNEAGNPLTNSACTLTFPVRS